MKKNRLKNFHDFELMVIWQGLNEHIKYSRMCGNNLQWEENLIIEIETELTNRKTTKTK